MRLTFTIAGLTPESGGPSRSVPALVQALAEAGNEITIVSLDYGHRESRPLAPDHGRVVTRWIRCRGSRRLPGIWSVRFARQLHRVIRDGQIDLLHDTGAWLPTNWLAARVAAQTGTPLILSPRGMLAGWSMRFKAARKAFAWHAFERSAVRSAALLHVTAESEAQELRALGFDNPIAMIPNGIELPPVGLRRDGRGGDRRTLLFLSRIHPKKGLEMLIEAWSRLPRTGWRLVVAGPAEPRYRQGLCELADRLGVATSIEFVGAVEGETKWRTYRNADLFVLPSYNENFGLVVGEALAAGVPVVLSRHVPWPGVEERRCGWWIEHRLEDLRDTLEHAMSLSDEERADMGRRGAEWVGGEFSWDGVGRSMAAAYQWILGQGPRPRCILEIGCPTGGPRPGNPPRNTGGRRGKVGHD